MVQIHSFKKIIQAFKNVCLLTVFFVSQVHGQTATIALTSEKQLIRGFGGINHPVWAGDLTADQRNSAFGNGTGQIGMSILRVWVSDNKNDWARELPTAQRAIALGAIVFASPWNPPSTMTETFTRGTQTNAKRLRYDMYDEYAQHLNDFVTYMKNNGVDIYAISIQNEPDYAQDWTWWTPAEMLTFMKNNAGAIQTRVIAPESFQYLKNMSDPILNDPVALANMDILGAHLYGTPLSSFPYPLFKQNGSGKELWMTEHYTESSNDADLWPLALDVGYEIHNCMVEAEFNAYVWWYIRRSYGMIKENSQVSKRGYCMAQYSKFIRPGYVRIDATKSPTTDVYISAYKKGDDVVIVAVNRSTSSKAITMSIPGTKVTTWEKYITSGSKSLTQESNIASSTGSFQVTLDPQSVTTFSGKAGAGTPMVAITAPANNAAFAAPASVSITATASDPDGTIFKVEFYNGTTLLGTDNTAPYSYDWTNVPAGTYILRAVATDNQGNTVEATVTIYVTPVANITASGSTTFCSGGSVVLNASTGTGYTYQWKRDGSSIANATSSSYTATQSGTYTVTVSANSQTVTSAPVSVTVNALPNTPVVASPVAYCQNATAKQLTASGTNLKWYTVSSGGTALATTPTPLTTAAGTTNYYVSQTTNGCESSRAMVAVTVNALPGAPAVSSPVAYCQNATAAQLTATGTNLKWYNVSSGGTALSAAPVPSTSFAGTTNYYVSQTINGCEGPRATIAVTINSLPNAVITPSGPATFVEGGSVTLHANTGLGLSYKWYNGITEIGTGSSYVAASAGSYTVEVTNAQGCKAASTAVIVTENQNQPSVITIVSPVSNASVSGPITITATVSDPDGGITKVEYLDGTTVIGTSSVSPYSFTWDNPAPGNHVITVRVTDSNGGVTTSAPVTVTSGISTGVHVADEMSATVYPNPSRGEITIETAMDLTNAKVSVISVAGEEIQLQSTVIGKGIIIDVSALAEGTYLFFVRQENVLLKKKIIVIR